MIEHQSVPEPLGCSSDHGAEVAQQYCTSLGFKHKRVQQFPERSVINNYEKKRISLDITERHYMVAQDDSGGNGTNQITVFANQCFDFMTEKRMTFDGCVAVQAADTINRESTCT